MDSRMLGSSGLRVSRLCFGTLTLSPAQADLPVEQAAELLAYAYGQGVTFWDTAELYENYRHLRAALRLLGKPPVICTKTYAYDKNGAQASLDLARRSLDLDVIDIVLLHEQESCLTMLGHCEAFAWLLEQKEKGRIRAVGLSTHAIKPVLALADARRGIRGAVWQDLDPGPYRQADVVHPLLNMRGIGLLDGGPDEMVAACEAAHDAGLGVFGMKMLGGGHLLQQFEAASDFALGLACADAYAVGMQDTAEVDMNVALFEGRSIDPPLLERTRERRRRLVVGDWCSGCGDCVRRCAEGALTLSGGQAMADSSRCIFCGYCATVCRDFAIKVV